MELSKAAIRTQARELGIDLLGFTSWKALEADAPAYDKPSMHSQHLTTLIVCGRRILSGVMASKDEALQQFVAGRSIQGLMNRAARLAYWLEEHGTIAAILSSHLPDSRTQPLDLPGPGAQGSMLLRQAAVQAGLGSLGLNTMLLTPEYGPRLYLAGILTDLPVEGDAPYAGELCLGLEACGRCAAICPADAIPRHAPLGAPVSSYRGLDAAACGKRCQPYGADRLFAHILDIAQTEDDAGRLALAQSPLSERLYHSMTVLRQGAFAGCMKCEQVCPVGADYERFSDTPVRRADLPDGVDHVVVEDEVTVQAAAQG